MRLWFILMYIAFMATGLSLIYIGYAISRFGLIAKISSNKKSRQVAYGFLIVSAIFALLAATINIMNAIICSVYFAGIWLLCDAIFYIIAKIRRRNFKKYYAGLMAFFSSVCFLSAGWYFAHNVWRTEYNLSTEKDIEPLKIVMFADSHVGTTFDAEGFARHIAKIQAENPDLVVVVGDFIDDDTSKSEMLKAAEILGKIQTKYGVYFVFGNHDEGYSHAGYRGYSGKDVIAELKKNGVKVLVDDIAALGDKFYLIGRQDFSAEKMLRGRRLPISNLIENFDENKYTIVLDHQPADYKNLADSKVDLVLSGHTHGGQLFPFNQVGKWIGVNDMIYGHEHRKNTDFIVTSGISDWAIKFKTGTKSEFVVINLKQKKK